MTAALRASLMNHLDRPSSALGLPAAQIERRERLVLAHLDGAFAHQLELAANELAIAVARSSGLVRYSIRKLSSAVQSSKLPTSRVRISRASLSDQTPRSAMRTLVIAWRCRCAA